MIKRYKSKIGIEFLLLAYLPFITLFYMAYTEFKLFGFIIICLLFVFMTYLVFATEYRINTTKKTLVVKCGFITQRSIDIEKIKVIKNAKSWISAPALSIDRIEITYNKFDSILISPKNQEDFINQLQQINPAIIYTY